MDAADTIKLTDLAATGGCAAKYSAAMLEELLRGFAPVSDENLTLQVVDDHTLVDSTYTRRVELAPRFIRAWSFTVHTDTVRPANELNTPK